VILAELAESAEFAELVRCGGRS